MIAGDLLEQVDANSLQSVAADTGHYGISFQRDVGLHEFRTERSHPKPGLFNVRPDGAIGPDADCSGNQHVLPPLKLGKLLTQAFQTVGLVEPSIPTNQELIAADYDRTWKLW